jgi:hypothetical protein
MFSGVHCLEFDRQSPKRRNDHGERTNTWVRLACMTSSGHSGLTAHVLTARETSGQSKASSFGLLRVRIFAHGRSHPESGMVPSIPFEASGFEETST